MQSQFPYNLFEKVDIVKCADNQSVVAETLVGKRVVALVLPYHNVEEAKAQIFKIFAACKIDAESVYVSNQIAEWASIAAVDTVKEVFLFGIKPINVGIFYQLFPYRFLDISNKKVLLADPLDLILGNNQLKADFWHKTLKPYYIGE